MTSEGKSGRRAGMAPKAAAKQPAARGRASRGILSMDSEQSARVLLIGAVTLIMLVAFGFIIFGYWYSVIRPRNRTVLQADQITISYGAMKRRMAYELFQNINLQQQPQALPELTYQTLLEEVTVINRAEADLGVAATLDEVDEKLRTKVGVGAEANQKQFADALLRQLKTTGLHDAEYRRLANAELLTSKIKDKFKLEAPLSAEQAKVEVIAVNTEADAKAAAARIAGGEDWARVAKAVSQEVDVQTTGGVHDYTPSGGYNPAYNSYVFDASTKIGDVSAPLPSASRNQYFLVRVDDRADKPVTDDQKPELADAKYHDWLVAQQDQMTVVRHWSTQDQSDALLSVVTDAGPRIRQQQQQSALPTVPTQQQQPPAQQPPADQAPAGGADQNPQIPGAPVAPGSGNGP
ncbi:MAG: peptidylprolyl isomerase [Chloroflexota bacterium]|nr:peptidylprolyl isomerase [Chloroflexota bacterium]